jgi:hypothetical protein
MSRKKKSRHVGQNNVSQDRWAVIAHLASAAINVARLVIDLLRH